MKLVHDADNVERLTIDCITDVPQQLRKLADKIEAGDYGDVSTVIALIESDGLQCEYYGELLSRYEAVGILALAQQAMLND